MSDIFLQTSGSRQKIEATQTFKSRSNYLKFCFMPGRTMVWTKWVEVTALISNNSAIEYDAEIRFPGEDRNPLTGGTVFGARRPFIVNTAGAVEIEVRYYNEIFGRMDNLILNDVFRKKKFIAGTAESHSASSISARCRSLSPASAQEVLFFQSSIGSLKGICRPTAKTPFSYQSRFSFPKTAFTVRSVLY